MSNSEKKGKDSRSIEEGSMESTTQSHYVQECESPKSKLTRIPIRWAPSGSEIIFKSWRSLERMAHTPINFKEKDKEKVEKVTVKTIIQGKYLLFEISLLVVGEELHPLVRKIM
ncbi:Uncharacterized protein TCM_035797 [Theobroma cacao]|uniref:Uncharacterized protein n=1 Tax=Theobroma cacao TaxID=3641 RepID=A0A061FHP7_THECC|nr:Uncharacterized protein TCM_035797 [Theobroma cacao]